MKYLIFILLASHFITTFDFPRTMDYSDGYLVVLSDSGRVDMHTSAIDGSITKTINPSYFDRMDFVSFDGLVASNSALCSTNGCGSFPVSASTLSIVSDESSDNDSLRVSGIGLSLETINEVISLNGLTQVFTDSMYFRVNSILKVNPLDTIKGNLTIVHQLTGQDMRVVSNDNTSGDAVFTTPLNSTNLISQLVINSDHPEKGILKVEKKPMNGSSFETIRTIQFSGMYSSKVPAFDEIEELTDVRVSVETATPVDVEVNFIINSKIN